MNNRVHQGHLARKRFGQNFLNDQFVIDSIVSAINPQKGQAMVEIGPGLAALTEPVGERLDQLTVIELDRDLAARLQTHPFLGPKLTIYQQDAMTMNFGELAEKMGQPLRVFGNLPYNISTPLMFHLFSVEVLTELGIDPAMRAENISVAQYCLMANWLSDNLPTKES